MPGESCFGPKFVYGCCYLLAFVRKHRADFLLSVILSTDWPEHTRFVWLQVTLYVHRQQVAAYVLFKSRNWCWFSESKSQKGIESSAIISRRNMARMILGPRSILHNIIPGPSLKTAVS